MEGLEEESFGLVSFGEAKFLGELMRGEDGAFRIKAVLGGVSFQDKAHIGYQRGTFDEEGSQVGKALEGFVELDQVGFEVHQVGVFVLFGASFVGVGGRCDFVYELEEGSIALDGGVLVEGLEERVFEVGCSAWGIGGLARRCGARGEGVGSKQAGGFSEEFLEGAGVRQHPCEEEQNQEGFEEVEQATKPSSCPEEPFLESPSSQGGFVFGAWGFEHAGRGEERSEKQRQDAPKTDACSIPGGACAFRHGFPSGFRGGCLEATSPRGSMLEGNLHIFGDFGKKKMAGGHPAIIVP